MATWLIVDGSSAGLGAAAEYYKDFPREPSPLGELRFDSTRITVMNDQTRSLETVLDTMPNAGVGGVVVLVCHGNDEGFLLPMVAGKPQKTALPALALVDQVIADEAAVAKIKAMPNNSKDQENAIKDAWRDFLNKIQPGMVSGDFDISDAEARYEQITGNRATNLTFSSAAALRAFIVKLKRVRDLKLGRLELRACNIASNPAKKTMATVRAFFNVGALTAPLVGTFYMGPTSPAPRPQAAHGAHTNHEVFGTAVPVGPLGQNSDFLDILESRVTAQSKFEATRVFLREKSVRIRGVGIIDGMGRNPESDFEIPKSSNEFTLTLHQFEIKDKQKHVVGHSYSAQCTVTPAGRRQDWLKVQSFVKGWIMPDSTYVSGPFRFAGLWTPNSADLRFALPNEREYLDFIAVEPPKNP